MYEDISGAWALIGDFNAITCDSERKGPPLRNPLRQESSLLTTINSCELLDAGFNGDPFTWERDGTRKRLDRMFINIQWRIRFSEVTIHHLPYYKSDHRALLVKFDITQSNNRHRRPFRFEAAWLTHNDFDRVVNEAWNISKTEFSTKLVNTTQALKAWNKSTFGHIFEKKRQLQRQLRQIDKQLARGWNHSILMRQKEIWQQYEAILAQEEVICSKNLDLNG